MRYNQYKYKFYLNANHSILIDGVMGQVHPHTWEIVIEVIKVVEGFVQFSFVEKAIEELLSKYQDKYINEIEPFDEINPTLENISEYFKEAIKQKLKQDGWMLLRLEISETPARSYIIDEVTNNLM